MEPAVDPPTVTAERNAPDHRQRGIRHVGRAVRADPTSLRKLPAAPVGNSASSAPSRAKTRNSAAGPRRHRRAPSGRRRSRGRCHRPAAAATRRALVALCVRAAIDRAALVRGADVEHAGAVVNADSFDEHAGLRQVGVAIARRRTALAGARGAIPTAISKRLVLRMALPPVSDPGRAYAGSARAVQVAPRTIRSSWSAASSRRSLWTTCANSSDAASSALATVSRASIWSGVSVAAADQPRAQRVLRRRRDEDADRVGHRVRHLARALDLDLEHHRRALGRALVQLRAQRSVAASGVLGVLEEVALEHAAVELDVVEEVVVGAVLLARDAARAWWRRRRARAQERARAACG